MANSVYNKGREAFLLGDIDWVADTIKVVLVDTNIYSFSQAHDFYNDVSGQVGSPVTLTSKTATDGVADAENATFLAVTGGTVVEAIVIYKDTGTPSTSALIAYIDSATGLPFTTNGGDVTVAWDAGANRIFKL